MILTELHFHTAESSRCGKVPAKQGLSMYKEAGYGAVVVTDHFSRYIFGKPEDGSWEDITRRFLEGYRAAKRESQALGIQVYLGMELRFPYDDNDFLVYGLDEEYITCHPWFYEKDLGSVHREFSRQGIVIFQAHPFRSCCTPADPDHLDGAEIFNGNRRHDSHNETAKAWALEHGLAGICGSDFHQTEDLSGAGVYLDRLPPSGKELARMLRQGEYRLVLPQPRENV